MTMKKLQSCFIASLFVLSLQAVEIVNWGNSNEYATGTANFTNIGGETSENFWRSGDPANVTPSTNYSAPSGKTNDIFAVFQQQTTDSNTTFVALNIADGETNNDFIRMTGRNNSTLSGLIYFTKSGFLNGYDSGSLGLSTVEEINWTLADQSVADSTSLRMAVLNGSQWYLSSAQSTSNAAGTTTFEDLGSVTWATWDPTGFPLDAAPGSFSVASSSLTDIQAFGMYFSTTRTTQTRLNISGFEVIAIPEPGTLALVGIALGSVLLFRRKK
jgi:hypothetical protein